MQYAQGNFDFEPIKIYSDDEIGDVATSLNYMASQLRDSNEYQQKFISNISHDFRSPLTSIKGYIEAIMDGTIPPEMQNKYLGIVLSEANRLEHLTNGLRDLNVWSNKGPELILEDFDVLELIHSSIETLEGMSSKKNIKLTIVNEAKKTTVNADKGKIEQVIYNLIDNAIKFSFNDSEIIVYIDSVTQYFETDNYELFYLLSIEKSISFKSFENNDTDLINLASLMYIHDTKY